MKSFLTILAIAVLAGAVGGCSSHSGGKPMTMDGGRDRHADTKVAPPTDGGVPDGDASVGDGPPGCGANGSELAMGATCACDSECSSHHCVDGLCCDTACTSGCETCSAPDAGGTCVKRVVGSNPRNPSDCKGNGTTCGLNGLCDGLGMCQYPVGNVCQGGQCAGDTVTGSYVCDGAGACKPGPSQTLCFPYTCNPATGSCFAAPCSDSGQCVAQHTCDLSSGSCGKEPISGICATDTDCLSNHCADHVCCNIACQGACVACNLSGRVGTCWPVDTGSPDPRTVCKDQGPASCGHDGTCDGVGGCSNYAKDTQCLASSCTGNRLNTAGTCDGLGTCRPPGVQDCHPFRCADGVCTTSCKTVADCDTGTACINNTCGPKPLGAVCAAASECQSNFCVDGVCCETACSGTCQFCALPTSPGTCSTVAADTKDPRGVCQDQGAASCGTNGKCDGTGSCESYSTSTVCAAETCVNGVFTAASLCTATGQCQAPSSRPCAPYVCNGPECFTVCTSNDQCKPPNTCNPTTNSCGLKGQGASCGMTAECQSGLFCAQGFCCNSPCGGACESCALPSAPGTCTNVPVNQVDPTAQCTDQGATSCGTNGKCDGNGSCQLYVQQTTCAASVCPSGTSTFTGTSTCDGAGKCVTPNASPCFPYECGVGVCKNSCTSNADCASPAVCINGSCGLKPPGQACVTGAECLSGFCSQAVCCTTACTGSCQSCALTTAPGTCTNVPNGNADPQGTCHDQGATTCGSDGFCDGNGACRKYAGGTSCASPSCPAGGTTLTSGRTCDGKGACQAATMVNCAPFLCNGTTACKGACVADTDCQSPDICDPMTSLCGNKKRLGQTCGVDTDCLTGDFCTDGVCCSSKACGTCQACNVGSSAGNCANVAANSSEPHGQCAPNASLPCGNTGACDGAGHCQNASTSTSCGSASCGGSTFTPVSHCTGTGTCAAPTSSACPGGFVCASNSTCKTTCTADTDCVAPLTCQGSGSTKSCALKPNGQSCASAAQCISGFCTDGVCCGSGPCGTCQACNVNGLGSCAAIPSGTTAPTGQCPSTGTCGNTGACNGSGACALAPTTVSCAAATCSVTTFTPVAFCSGTGTCTPATSSSCAPYICGTSSCNATCSSDTQCVASGGNNSYCTSTTGGACVPVKGPGVACLSNHECGSGFCVDGVCCGSASCPTCQACNVSGSAGTCANVASGVNEPHLRCAANGTCGNTGTCNGAGACVQTASTVSCAGPTCSGSTFTPTSFCSGNGACSTPGTQSCAPYKCGATACNNTCSADTDCIASGGVGSYCTSAGGSCLPVKGPGVACLASHECGSGFCVDGVCCGTASCGTCQSCNVSGSAGVCANVANGVNEPHSRCAAGGTCGNTGTCNGAGACTQASTSVTCGSASCSGSTFTPVAFCNGAGSCSTPTNSSCSPYLCGGTSCNNSCNLDSDCVNVPGNNNYCTATNGSCLPVKANGVACGTNHECGSGFCIDGVCCASNGCGTCQACNIAGSLGACGPVANGVTDPHTRCTPNGTCGNTGACNGAGACQQQPVSVMCSGPSCTGGTATLASFCSGTGTCPAPGTQLCGDYLCGGTACKSSCTADTDCIGTDFCAAGICTAKLAAGKTCTTANQCGTGFCADGVCCTTNGCTAATCQACNLNGVGTCSAIPAGQAAPGGQCPTGATCGNTGLCNGSSGCQQQTGGTVCNPASCSSSSLFQPASTCNGSGSCVTPAANNCGAYVCAAGGCPTTCTRDTDCASGDFCNAGSCVAQQAQGTACTANDQCGGGTTCAQGFCCNSACTGPCQSCALAGSPGTCTSLPSTTVCMSSCSLDNLTLTQNFCDGLGNCSGVPVISLCGTASCSVGPPPVCQ